MSIQSLSHDDTTAASKLKAVLASGALLAFLAPIGCLSTVPAEEEEEDGDLAVSSQALVGSPVMGDVRCNDQVRLKSWKGDYLNRPNTDIEPRVTTAGVNAFGNAWTIECKSNGTVQLRSWKGDYLHRPDTPQGVTTWTQGEWTVVPVSGANVMLKSWKGDYLHRPDSPQGVTTWDQGTWTVESVAPMGAWISMLSRANGRYVCAEDGGNSPLLADRDHAQAWETFQVLDQGNGNVALKSMSNGRYVTATNAGNSPLIAAATQVNSWELFHWEDMGNGDFALKALVNNRYVAAMDAGNSALLAAAAAPSTWETFHWAPSTVPDPDLELVQTFAPRLHFDSAAPNYPMSAQQFHSTNSGDNTSYAIIANNQVPTYYQVTKCGGQTRIMYWWFYGYQNTCDGVSGAHNGDWENVMVTLSDTDRTIAAVTYWLHGDHYTRLRDRGGVNEIEAGAHVVVHVGKTSHASYYNQGGTGSCLMWEDFHHDGGATMDSWNNLVSLDSNAEPWMLDDRAGNFSWGVDGVNTHPTTQGPSCYMQAASWGEAHWGTQCKLGDDDSGVECLRQCASGYTNGGLICTNWSTWSSYTRERYSYQYDIPTSNLGLKIEDY